MKTVVNKTESMGEAKRRQLLDPNFGKLRKDAFANGKKMSDAQVHKAVAAYFKQKRHRMTQFEIACAYYHYAGRGVLFFEPNNFCYCRLEQVSDQKLKALIKSYDPDTQFVLGEAVGEDFVLSQLVHKDDPEAKRQIKFRGHLAK